ncbi:MAG: luxQ [Gammaproteobacteria bacterium]|jgi:PAS domain S-box-containing protein|nr:luxQ [Gammaproteobacteria bacterium]
MVSLALEHIKFFLAQLAEYSDNVYWVADPEFTHLVYVSPAYEKIWGCSRQSLYDSPRKWVTCLHAEDQKRHPIFAMREEIVHKGLEARFQANYRIIRPDGEIRWIIDRGFPVCDDTKKLIAITGVAIDVTQDKKREEALFEEERQVKLAQAKSRFIANMSHDIKTPLSGMIGLADVLSSYLKGGRELSFVKSILSAGRELMSFFENCIDMTRAENSEIIFIREHFSLKELLNELTRLFEPAVISKQLSFSVRYPDNIGQFFLGSRTGIYRVLLNLIGNAIKFTPSEGSVCIDVDYSEKSSSSKQVMLKLTVQDTGIGIPQDKQHLIFERYNRLSPSYQNIYSGTGTGLYIASQFVKAMKGEIYVTSEEGKGSHFLLVLPLEIPLLRPEEYKRIKNLSPPLRGNLNKNSVISLAEKKENKEKELRIFYNIKILLVEDNILAQKVAQSIFMDLGCQVDTAGTGKDALGLFKIGKYDLVFMDIGLPDTSGYTVTEEIRKIESDTSFHVPIIVLTAHAVEDTEVSFKNIGAEEILSKPLSKEQARNIIERYLVCVESA